MTDSSRSYYPASGVRGGYDNYPDWAKKRFTMKPGVTGMAQITVRNSVSWDERIIVDNRYIDSFSILLDLKILILTINRLFKSENIYMEKRDK